jgi:hypothetical protein
MKRLRQASAPWRHEEYKFGEIIQEPLVVLLDHLGEWGKLGESLDLAAPFQPTSDGD